MQNLSPSWISWLSLPTLPRGKAANRSSHAGTTLLSDGTVLVIGGTAELYNRASGTFTAATSLLQSRSGHTATRLLDGRVLVAGGYGPSNYGNSTALTSAELYY